MSRRFSRLHAPRRVRAAMIYAAAWMPFVAVYVGVLTAMTDASMHVASTIVAAFLNALGPAVMGVGVWLITKRLSWPEARLGVLFGAHAALATAFTAGWMFWQYAISGPLGPTRPPDYALLRYVLPWQAAIGFILYGVVAGVSYAVRSLTRSRDLRVAAERAERLRAQAELATLRAHINPHFFFNTLHLVSQFLRSDVRRAETALEELSSLFRYVLRLDRHNVEVVTLEEEWHFTRTYLALEQMRMGSRLVVREDVEDDVLDCAVPPFTLQPLVENAVRHGIAPVKGGGTISVMAREREGRLEISVADDGVGARGDAAQRDVGVGSRAVTQRLSAKYGDAVETRVDTSPGRGYRVTLLFPAEPVAVRP